MFGSRWTEKQRNSYPGLCAIALLTAIALAACGGNTAATPAPTPTGASATATNAPQPGLTTPAAASPARPASSPTATTGPTQRTPTNARATTAPPSSPRTGGATPMPAPEPVAFRPAPWRAGERTVYTIETKDTGQNAGQATYTIGRDSAADSISASIAIGSTQDRFQLGFDSQTLQPFTEIRTIVTTQGSVDIRAEYHASGATIETTSRSGTQVARINLPSTYYANDQFVVLLRALPFAEGYRGKLTLVLPQGEPPTTEVIVVVSGQEPVTTPLGPIHAWRVEATFDNSAPQILWYAVEDPHYLVKYDNRRYVWLLSQQP